MPSNKIKRKALARILTVGCNALDSVRIMTINEIIRRDEDSGVLSSDEVRFLERRSAELKRQINAIRKFSWILDD